VSSLSTRDIYSAHAQSWVRKERILLSDFTARPYVMDELVPLAGAHVLDLGCGEGYVARLAAEAGAASVMGIDVSPEMVASALAAIPPEPACAFRFEVGDAASLPTDGHGQFDRIIAVFLFNYLTRTQTLAPLRFA
jgi:cyclopropane fatty-acyl-phospholipid synthase-like methyltransferase